MNKKILVVCQHFWPESFRVNDICDFFVEKGCDVEVLCGLPNYPSGKFTENYGYFKNREQIHKGIKIHRVFEVPRGNNSNFRIFLNYISFPIASLFHIPRLLAGKYDKIFIYQLSPVMMSIAGIIVGKLKRVETTMYVLDLWPENLYSVLNIKSPLLRKVAEKVSHWHYRHVDKLVVLSEKMRGKLAEITRMAPEKITVLPQTSEKIYEENMRDIDLTQRFADGFNIVYAGNISPAQSFETILEAAISLREMSLNINWIIVGDGMSKKNFENEVRKSELSDTFHFEGHKPISDIPKYTDVADVLIGCLVKSDLLEATIPAKVMSYIAAGKPIVLAMDGEVQQLINSTIGCGYAGPAGNAEQFTSNIAKILRLSVNERKRMGQKGRDYHFEHFERNVILSKLYNFMFDKDKL